MLKDILEGKPLRHPLHPFLVHFPIGLFALSLLLDLASLLSSRVPEVVPASFYCMALGVIASIVAAIPGFVDFTDIRQDHPAKRIGLAHMSVNLVVVGIYALNLGLRASALAESRVATAPLLVSLVAIGLLGISGYLGGMLVYDDGIAVGRHRRHTTSPHQTIRLSARTTTGKTPEGSPGLIEVPGAEHLKDGESLRLELDGSIIALFNDHGSFFAVQEFCTHRFGPLSEGTVRNGQVVCPWHGSSFELRSGLASKGPAKVNLKTFEVKVASGRVYLRAPSPDALSSKPAK